MARSRRRTRTPARKRQTSRSRSKSISALKVAEQIIVANAVTKGLFDTDLRTFIMPTSSNVKQWDNSWEITAPELLGMVIGGTGGMDARNWNLKKVVERNIKNNGLQSLLTVVGAPIAFRIGRRLLSKSIVNPANRMLKKVGVKEVKL
jgi:hypothetical protein